MGTLLVLVIAVGVGVLVYRLTAGPDAVEAQGRGTPGPATRAPGSAGDATPTPPPDRPVEAPEGYIPVAPGRASWHSRLGGAMGLVIAVAVGAIALALSVWALVEFVSRMFADTGGAVPVA